MKPTKPCTMWFTSNVGNRTQFPALVIKWDDELEFMLPGIAERIPVSKTDDDQWGEQLPPNKMRSALATLQKALIEMNSLASGQYAIEGIDKFLNQWPGGDDETNT